MWTGASTSRRSNPRRLPLYGGGVSWHTGLRSPREQPFSPSFEGAGPIDAIAMPITTAQSARMVRIGWRRLTVRIRVTSLVSVAVHLGACHDRHRHRTHSPGAYVWLRDYEAFWGETMRDLKKYVEEKR